MEKVFGYVGPELRREAQTGDRELEVISIWLVGVEMVQREGLGGGAGRSRPG